MSKYRPESIEQGYKDQIRLVELLDQYVADHPGVDPSVAVQKAYELLLKEKHISS